LPPRFERFLVIEMDAGKTYQKLSFIDKFKFSCHKGLTCFGQCCSDVNIFLTPYDVLRLKKALNISSGRFLKNYTTTFLTEQKLSLVLLKMKDDARKSCPFVTPKGCSVYNHRPWACRMYPIGTTTKTADPASDEEYTFIAGKDSPCLGTKENREWTVSEWLQNQGLDRYNQKSEPYRAITLQNVFREGSGLTLPKAQMLYVALYDLDRFREFLFDSSFFERFRVDAESIEKIRIDDEELLNFGYEWLKFSLFGEKTIKIKDEALTKRKRVPSQTKGKRRAK
jgi:Fe-S-cluster containining protein